MIVKTELPESEWAASIRGGDLDAARIALGEMNPEHRNAILDAIACGVDLEFEQADAGDVAGGYPVDIVGRFVTFRFRPRTSE